jgi:hypothetical protein
MQPEEMVFMEPPAGGASVPWDASDQEIGLHSPAVR